MNNYSREREINPNIPKKEMGEIIKQLAQNGESLPEMIELIGEVSAEDIIKLSKTGVAELVFAVAIDGKRYVFPNKQNEPESYAMNPHDVSQLIGKAEIHLHTHVRRTDGTIKTDASTSDFRVSATGHDLAERTILVADGTITEFSAGDDYEKILVEVEREVYNVNPSKIAVTEAEIDPYRSVQGIINAAQDKGLSVDEYLIRRLQNEKANQLLSRLKNVESQKHEDEICRRFAARLRVKTAQDVKPGKSFVRNLSKQELHQLFNPGKK